MQLRQFNIYLPDALSWKGYSSAKLTFLINDMIRKKLFITAAAFAAIVGCNKIENLQPEDYKYTLEPNEIAFRASSVGTKAFTEATATSLQSGWNCLALMSDGTQMFNTALSYQSGIYRVSGKTYYYPLGKTMEFYGCYPTSLNIDAGTKSIEYAQNPDTDLIVAKKTGLSAQSDAVSMEFSHALSQVDMKVKGSDTNADYFLKNLYLLTPADGTYAFTDNGWTSLGTATEYSYYTNAGAIVSTSVYQAFGSSMSFIPGPAKLRAIWECRNKNEDTVIGSYDVTVDVNLQQGMHSTLNLTLPNSDAKEINLSVTVQAWKTESKDIEIVEPTIQFDYKSNYFHGEISLDEEYDGMSIYSYIEYTDGTKEPSPWTTEFSTDGGTTFTSTKPNWLLLSITSGIGGEDGEYMTFGTGPLSTVSVETLNGHDNVWITSNSALTSASIKGTSSAPVDLSMCDYKGQTTATKNTANCYIVSAPGYYKIPLVYGNAIKNSTTNTEAFYTSIASDFEDSYGVSFTASSSPYIKDHASAKGKTIASASILWNDSTCGIDNITVTSDELSFHIAEGTIAPANILLGVKDSDGKILWSYHIWVTGLDLTPKSITNTEGKTFKVMPYNLGWNGWNFDGVTRTEYESRECIIRFKSGNAYKDFKFWNSNVTYTDGTMEQTAPYYQWGRKDPFIASETPGTNVIFSKVTTSASVLQAQYLAHQNPQNFYYCTNSYSWTTDKYTYFWDSKMNGYSIDQKVTKTIYDPTPAGWNIPQYNTFTNFDFWYTNENFEGRMDNGWYIKTDDGNEIYFPLSGCRGIGSGSVDYVGGSGYCWLSAPYSENDGHQLILSTFGPTPQDYYDRCVGFSVRPLLAE